MYRMLISTSLKFAIGAFLTATNKGFVLKGVDNTALLEQWRPVGSGVTGRAQAPPNNFENSVATSQV